MVGEKSKTPKNSKKMQIHKDVLYAIIFNTSGLVDQIPIHKGRPTTGCVYKDQVLKKNYKAYIGRQYQIQKTITLVFMTVL